MKCILERAPVSDAKRAAAYYNCAKSGDTEATAECLSNLIGGAELKNIKKQGKCLSGAADTKAVLDCMKLGPAERALVSCFEAAGSDARAAAKCIVSRDKNLKAVIDGTRCVESAAGDRAKVAACAGVVFRADPKIVKAATCLEKTGADQAQCIADAAGVGGDAANAAIVATCVTDEKKTTVDKLDCIAGIAGADREKTAIALCLASGGSSPVDCAALDPDLEKGVKAYKCASAAGDTAGMLENCSEAFNIGDKKTIKTVACLARSGGDNGRMAACAASGVLRLGKNEQRMLDCAGQSTGYTDFAICASGSNMNAEWRIAAECVTSTGGEPISSASCTAGRLTLRELQKCIAGGMKLGTDDCYGKNNTIRKYYDSLFKLYADAGKTAYHDLTKGLGKNNEFRVAGRKIDAFRQNVSKEIAKVGERAIEFARQFGKEMEGVIHALAYGAEHFGGEVKKTAEKVWHKLTRW